MDNGKKLCYVIVVVLVVIEKQEVDGGGSAFRYDDHDVVVWLELELLEFPSQI